MLSLRKTIVKIELCKFLLPMSGLGVICDMLSVYGWSTNPTVVAQYLTVVQTSCMLQRFHSNLYKSLVVTSVAKDFSEPARAVLVCIVCTTDPLAQDKF